ncbi:MAG TPA: O-antigen ligase family protein [Halothiobacillus sp.]|nr:O-antigen ligase family protein [Halothiobacillus sp.]
MIKSTSTDSLPNEVPGASMAARWLMLGVLLLPILVLFKRVPAEIAVGLTVLVGLYIAYRRRDFTWLAEGWVYAAAGLSLILLLLAPFSVDPGYSALSAVLAFRWPVFAGVLIWLFTRRPDTLALFERSMAAVMVFIIVDTLLQYVTGTDIFGHAKPEAYRLTGPFAHSLVGSFTDRIWFIGLAVVWFSALRWGEGRALLAAAVASAIGTLFLFLTGERAAFLTFLMGSGLVFLGIILHYPRWRVRLVGLALVGMALVVGVAATQKEMVGRSVDSTIHTISHLDETVYGLNFLTGLEEFQAHPWTGVGAREFKAYCDTQMPKNHAQYNAMGFDGCVLHPHNFYTGMLAEGGIGSFLIFAAMVILMFVAVVRGARQANQPFFAYFGAALLLTSFWPIQSSMEYFNGWTAALIWTGVAWSIARARTPFRRVGGA